MQDFAEYLWQFAFFPQRYRKVLASYPAAGTSQPGHTLLLGFASTQGNDRFDLIEIVEWRFVSAPESGEITSEFSMVRSFEAVLADGSLRLCVQ